MSAHRLSRRRFLRGLAVAGVGAATLSASSWNRVYGANERLRVASVGTGGKGKSDLLGVAASPAVEVVALCNIDDSAAHLGWAAEKFPAATKYADWRRLLDRANSFDALIVSTPDHMHAPVALPAMGLKKHVFCQKPLTHTVFEARQMQLAAQKYGVVTQMGNQIQSRDFYRTATKLVRDGAIGKVQEVHSWQSGAMGWILVDDRPPGADPVPAGVQWDLWLGVAPARPFKQKIYHAFNWRAWQDYSNGQLGDFGCHILDPVFTSLDLTAPTTIRAEAAAMNREIWYKWSTVHYEFPGTNFTAGSTLSVTWYDGDGRMPTPEQLKLAPGTMLPKSGSVLIGQKGSLLVPHVQKPVLFVDGRPSDRAIEMLPDIDHYVAWADACRGEGRTGSHFAYAGNLTETVLLGTVAIRTPGETLSWNSAQLKITNNTSAQELLTKRYRQGWEPSWV